MLSYAFDTQVDFRADRLCFRSCRPLPPLLEADSILVFTPVVVLKGLAMRSVRASEERSWQCWERVAEVLPAPRCLDAGSVVDLAERLLQAGMELLPTDASGRPVLGHSAGAHRRLLQAALLAVQAERRSPQLAAAGCETGRHIGAYFKLCWPSPQCACSMSLSGRADDADASSSSDFSPRSGSCLQGSPEGICVGFSATCDSCSSLAELSDVLLLFCQAAGILRPAQPLDRRVAIALTAVAWLDDPAARALVAEQLAAVQGPSSTGSSLDCEGCAVAAGLPPLTAVQLLHACCCLAARGAARLAQAQEDAACLSDAAAMQAVAGRPHPLSRAELAALRSGALRCAELLLALEPGSPEGHLLAGDATALAAYAEDGRPASEAALARTAALRMERYLHACHLAAGQSASWWSLRAAAAALQLAGEPGTDSLATLRAALAAWRQAEPALRQHMRRPAAQPSPWRRAAAAEAAACKRLLQRCGPALSLLDDSEGTTPGAAVAAAALLAATLQRARLDVVRLDSSPDPASTQQG